MKKIELLAPAGDKESLIAAIQNGADAIYLGGTLFNARTYARNFNDEELKWAVEYAHLHEVKIYVTVNTLYKDSEFEELMSYIKRLYHFQVDALIVQDLGLFHVLREYFPDFDIHMSTQASVMNVNSVSYFEEAGASRVVLARENTIEEIQEICSKTSIEIEVFIHGALCVCYSGQCLMSSFIGKRSGNRGSCAQPCRLRYDLCLDGQTLESRIPFLLSPKDLMTIDHIGEFIDAGVTSFKIEGRMKKPEYVASVVHAYRKAIDGYISQTHVDFQQEIHDMKAMFNRDYTNGYIFHDKEIVKGDYSGNKGMIIGKVINYNKKRNLVKIKLNDCLTQGDSIVFQDIDKGRPINKIYKNNKLVRKALQGEVIEVEFNYPVYGGLVRKTTDIEILNKLNTTYQKENIRLPISIQLKAHINSYAQLDISYNDKSVTTYSKCQVEKALKTPITKERIEKQLSKLGDNPFFIQNIEIKIDHDITIPIKELNEMRREAISQLSYDLSHNQIHHTHKQFQPLNDKNNNTTRSKKIYVLISRLSQLEAIVNEDIDIIFYPYQKDSIKAYQICCKHHKKFGLFIPRICKERDLQNIIKSDIYQHVDTVIVNEMGAYHLMKDKNRILGTGINIFNSYSCEAYPLPKILSLEMSKKQIGELKTDLTQCILQIYGKIENMVSEYCPISQYYYGKQNKKCNKCKKGQYSLKDRKGELFDIMMDEQCRMHLLNCHTLFIDQFHSLNIGGLFIHFTNEDDKDTYENLKQLVSFVKNRKYNLQINKRKTTLGYFKE